MSASIDLPFAVFKTVRTVPDIADPMPSSTDEPDYAECRCYRQPPHDIHCPFSSYRAGPTP